MRARPQRLIGADTSSPAPRRRTLAMGSYILGWLRPTESVYPSSRPSLYLTVPWRFRFVPASAWPRLGGAVDAGSCHAGSLSRGGDTLGARSGPRRNRSGVLKARFIVLPPWDSVRRPMVWRTVGNCSIACSSIVGGCRERLMYTMPV